MKNHHLPDLRASINTNPLELDERSSREFTQHQKLYSNLDNATITETKLGASVQTDDANATSRSSSFPQKLNMSIT